MFVYMCGRVGVCVWGGVWDRITKTKRFLRIISV